MAKIRADLVGVVIINRQRYRAGDTLPPEAKVDKSLLAPEKEPAAKKEPATKKEPPAEKQTDKN